MIDPNHPEERARRLIRGLIWTYFWLLLVEGALRKWILPGLSNPLLVIRDPVALLIYFFSLRARVFPKDNWTVALIVIGLITTATTFIRLMPYFPLKPIVLVAGYGIHANFFHLPLIFIMAEVLSFEDIKRFGWWILLLMIPMTALMVAQFRAAPDAFLNRTAGGEGEMMMSALGKVRTAGPFSFVIGVVAYFSLATAFFLWGILNPRVYKMWLLWAAGAALGVGTAVSGSRSVVVACVLVFASLAILFFVRRDSVNRIASILVSVVILALVISRLPVFREGLNVITTRFNEVSEATEQGVAVGLIARVWNGVSDTGYVIKIAPLFGYGVGIGTNAGANILTGHAAFLFTEGEWSRVLLESGPIVGLAYIIWRIALAWKIFVRSLRSMRFGNILPFLIFTSAGFPLVLGQFGQPTILGFTVFAIGLTLAALKGDSSNEPPPVTATAPVKRVLRRSPYAERLHGQPAGSGQSNGSVDR